MIFTKDLYLRTISSLILLPLTIYLSYLGSIWFMIYIFFFLILSIYEWHQMTFKIKYYYLGIIFLLFSFYCVGSIRLNDDANSILNFTFILLVCIGTDVGGYIFGKFFKGPKLTKISPNKTYSGVIGSYIVSLGFVYLIILNPFNFFQNPLQLNLNILIKSLVLSSVCQIGDLLISFFKRKSDIKDTGKIIPGHGGVLDRIDGMIFAFPTFYILNLIK